MERRRWREVGRPWEKSTRNLDSCPTERSAWPSATRSFQWRKLTHWSYTEFPGHVGIHSDEEANELAKTAVEEASLALAKSTAAREKRTRAKRGLRAMAFGPNAATKLPFSDGDSEYEGGVRRGDFAMTICQIAARARLQRKTGNSGRATPRRLRAPQKCLGYTG